MEPYQTTVQRNEIMCQGEIKALTIREDQTSFTYNGVRGHVQTKKGRHRAVAYLTFLNELRVQFNPRHIYHAKGTVRFMVPMHMDHPQARMFLSILDEASNSMQALEQRSANDG